MRSSQGLLPGRNPWKTTRPIRAAHGWVAAVVRGKTARGSHTSSQVAEISRVVGRVKLEHRLHPYCPLGVRVIIQMSVPPRLPDRLDANTSVRPSVDRPGCW